MHAAKRSVTQLDTYFQQLNPPPSGSLPPSPSLSPSHTLAARCNNGEDVVPVTQSPGQARPSPSDNVPRHFLKMPPSEARETVQCCAEAPQTVRSFMRQECDPFLRSVAPNSPVPHLSLSLFLSPSPVVTMFAYIRQRQLYKYVSSF